MSTGDTSGNFVGYSWGSTTSIDETGHPSNHGWEIADAARKKTGSSAWQNWNSNASAHLYVAAGD